MKRCVLELKDWVALVNALYLAIDEEATDLALTCCIFSLTWARSCINTRWIEMTWLAGKLKYHSKHWSDIVFGSYLVLSVLTSEAVRSNVNLENWSLARSLAYRSCEVKGGRRIVLDLGFQLTLPQDIFTDDVCTHDMSTIITRLYTIVESRHHFHLMDVFLMSSCLRLIHLKDWMIPFGG